MRHTDELGNLYMLACLVGGPVLIFVGARAAGLAVIGSLIGAVVAVAIVANDYDAIFSASATGGTIGAFVAGLAGLLWRPRKHRDVLVAVCIVVACSAAFAITALPWPDWVRGWLVVDATLVVALIAIQAVQAPHPDIVSGDTSTARAET